MSWKVRSVKSQREEFVVLASSEEAELRRLVLRGCTVSQIAKCLGDQLKGGGGDTGVFLDIVYRAFGILGGYLLPLRSPRSHRERAIVNASLLPEIVALKNEWQPKQQGGHESWIDEVDVAPPAPYDEDAVPSGITPSGWASLSDEDKRVVKQISTSGEITSYRCALLAVLCE